MAAQLIWHSRGFFARQGHFLLDLRKRVVLIQRFL